MTERDPAAESVMADSGKTAQVKGIFDFVDQDNGRELRACQETTQTHFPEIMLIAVDDVQHDQCGAPMGPKRTTPQRSRG
jgi:hypothetical protein